MLGILYHLHRQLQEGDVGESLQQHVQDLQKEKQAPQHLLSSPQTEKKGKKHTSKMECPNSLKDLFLAPDSVSMSSILMNDFKKFTKG